MTASLDARARDIFKLIVDAYVETGEPVGSRTLATLFGARNPGQSLSPATIRAVMAELEASGLLHAPHTSAGRVPTDQGLRLFVDGLLETGDITTDERNKIEARCKAAGRHYPELMEQASTTLAGLSACAGLVVAPKGDRVLKQIEFVALSPGRILVILVSDDGNVENRVIDAPLDLPASALIAATNYLNHHLASRTIAELRAHVVQDIAAQRAALDALTAKLVQNGLAVWSGDADGAGAGQLIIKGQAQLLQDVQADRDLERIRKLFETLEARESMLRLVEASNAAEGVRIFIGAEHDLFADTGCAMIVSPYKNGKGRIVGAVGVIGPTRLNYARIIPLVDYTAKVMGRLLD